MGFQSHVCFPPGKFLGFYWNAARGKELFTLVCVGVFLTCLIRIVFFSVGYLGVGTSSLPFVILDKLSSLLFALTILVFVYLWAKAIAIMSEAPPAVVPVLTVAALAVALAITIVTI